ncbi:MAG: hypothetical protein R6V06_05385 [Kiritimatiellia bacterium]
MTLFIANGAHWLWDIRRIHFPFAVEILDFYHAAEYLEPILEIAGYREKKRIFKKWRKWLKQGKIEQFIEVADELWRHIIREEKQLKD